MKPQVLYLMSPPGPRWALRGRSNFRSEEAAPVNAALAFAEWFALAQAIEQAGGTVVCLPSPSDELTGMPYAAEAGHLFARPDGALDFLLPRMKSPHRQGEAGPWGELLTRLGARLVQMPEEVVWEAQGDVAHFRGVTLLFYGGRTTEAGMEAARRHFQGPTLALQIHEPAFHGNMAVLPLGRWDRLLFCPAVMTRESLAQLEARFGAKSLLEVTLDEVCCYATNGLPLGYKVIVPALVPKRILSLLASLGAEVQVLPMPELCDKGGGGPRCLVSVAEVPAGSFVVPEENRLSSVPIPERLRRPWGK